MGTYSKGILGPFSGKVGTVVGSTWKGIDYMRSLPKPSSKTPSDAQMEQRVKLALAVGFIKPISSLVSLGFKKLATNNTAFNISTAQIVKEAISGAYPDFTIDYARVLISMGELTGPWNAALASAVPGMIDVSWTVNGGSGTAKDTDTAILLVYNPVKNLYAFVLEGAARSAGMASISVPESFSGDRVHCWMSFIAADKKMIATSVYLGEVEVAY